jgi:hypothetical protein
LVLWAVDDDDDDEEAEWRREERKGVGRYDVPLLLWREWV